MDKDNRETVGWVIVAIGALFVVFGAGFVTGMQAMDMWIDPPAVCHSSTEELHENTIMLDCKFIDGAWYPEEVAS